MLNNPEFDATEAQLIEDARKAYEAEQVEQTQEPTQEPPKEPPKEAETSEAQTEAKADPVAEQAQDEPKDAPKDEPPNRGEPRAALRASRRAEQHLRKQLEAANAELEKLRAAQPKGEQEDDISDVVAELESDLPGFAKVAKVVQKLQAELREARQQNQRQTQADPEFIPPSLPPEVQEIVDDVPDLLAWQNDRDQTAWNLAVKADTLLADSPRWKDKPQAQRFAEVVRVVHEQLGTPSKPSAKATVADAQRVIAKAQATAPLGIGDLRGGTAATTTGRDYRGMSDEQIIASLPP